MATFQPPHFFNKSVGGVNMLSASQTLDQMKILQMQGQKKQTNKDQQSKLKLFNDLQKSRIGKELDENTIMTPDTNNGTYRPEQAWKENHGLIGETNSRYNVRYLHIDSLNRQKEPMMEISNYYTLSENPILTTELSEKIFIRQPNHPFVIEDKITIDGISPATYKLRYDPTNSLIPIEFVVGQRYMIIHFAHGIPETHASDAEISNLFMALSDFTNEGTTGNSLYFGNIVLTFINKNHSFFLENKVATDILPVLPFDANKMYIELPYTYVDSPGTPSTLPRYITLALYYANGVPMNIINAQYPTDIYHTIYYQIIREVSTDGYYINLSANALASGYIGGKTVRIGQISDFTGGYAEPNFYIIPLEEIYKNVVSVRLLSTEFPNSEYVIKSYPESSRNNRIYWQNYEDGSHIYSLEVTPGKYNSTTLITIIESKFYDTARYYYPSVTSSYTDHNYVQVSLDTDTDTTTFKAYKEAVMVRPFVNAYYIRTDYNLIPEQWDHKFVAVGSDPTSDPNNYPEQMYPVFILIKYLSHGLKLNTMYYTHEYHQDYVPNGSVGDSIIITGTTSFLGIPGSKIDGTYEVYKINQEFEDPGFLGPTASDNYFMIKLLPLDMGQYKTREMAQNGGIFYMYTPNKFRLLFNFSDTIGSLLGFPNVGETYAVTKYDSVITNKDPYEPDIRPAMDLDITTPGNAMILCGYNYILMTCEELPVIDTIGKIKKAFSKIIFTGIPGKMCFNSFISTPKIFYEPISQLSQLTISFYSPQGELYDFNGLDHSFTLEITTLDELPYDTHINTHTGKIL